MHSRRIIHGQINIEYRDAITSAWQRIDNRHRELIVPRRQIHAVRRERRQRLLAQLKADHRRLVKAPHHVTVYLVNGAAADRVMGMIAQHLLPGDPQVRQQFRAPGGCHHPRERQHRLGPAFQQTDGGIVGLLQADTGRDAVRDQVQVIALIAAGIAQFTVAHRQRFAGGLPHRPEERR